MANNNHIWPMKCCCCSFIFLCFFNSLLSRHFVPMFTLTRDSICDNLVAWICAHDFNSYYSITILNSYYLAFIVFTSSIFTLIPMDWIINWALSSVCRLLDNLLFLLTFFFLNSIQNIDSYNFRIKHFTFKIKQTIIIIN